jgi:hypothetical protein
LKAIFLICFRDPYQACPTKNLSRSDDEESEQSGMINPDYESDHSIDEKAPPLAIENPPMKLEFLHPRCHREGEGCTVDSPYNLISLNGTLTCLDHEHLLDAIVYPNKTFKQDRIGTPLCHGLKCRRAAKLRAVYGGLYCKVHLLEIQLGKVSVRTRKFGEALV